MALFQIVHQVSTVIDADNETQAEELAREALNKLPVEVLEDAEITFIPAEEVA